MPKSKLKTVINARESPRREQPTYTEDDLLESLYSSVVNHLEPEILAQWIVQGRDDFVVIDVRESDYKYGHITGSVHIPANEFDQQVERILDNFPLDKTYVFHCMRSEIRGPRCARKFVRHLVLNTPVSGDFTLMPNIYLLNGGLKRWNRLYGDDPSLMEPIE